MDWLTNFKDWFIQVIKDVWTAVSGFYHDMSLAFLRKVLEVVAEMVKQIQVPAWMADYSVGHLFSYLSPSLGYFVDRLGFSVGISLIGAGYAFRVARKLATALQW